MKVKVNNKEINLTSKDFKTQGGEGQIYIKSNTVYKIYIDSKRAIPENKFKELNKLTNNKVIKPQSLIYSNNKIVGYTMNLVPQAIALCQLFPKAFKDRNNISNDMIQNLILNFRGLVQSIHKDKCLIVDLNELNFLVNNLYDTVYAIDVDSYQTPSYKATAIMPSIRDRHSNTFTEETDWFSFAVLAFQLFIGIHPYKGIHKTLKTLDDRMINNISVLNKTISLPKACNDISVIPKNWLNWFELLFEKGERMSPPEIFESIIQVAVKHIQATSSDVFNIKKLFTIPDNIDHCFYNDKYYTITKESLSEINGRTYTSYLTKDTIAVSYLNIFNSVCSIERINNTLYITPLNSQKIKLSVNVDGVIFDQNNLYVKSDESVYIVEYHKNTSSLTTFKVANVMQNSTEFFGGCLIQNMLGTKYLTYFNNKEMYNIKLDLIDKIINARKIGSYLGIILLMSTGEYLFQLYNLDKTDLNKLYESIVTYNDINFTVNDSGIGFAIIDDEQSLVFNKKSVKHIQSSNISMTQRLFTTRSSLNYFQDNKVYQISLK